MDLPFFLLWFSPFFLCWPQRPLHYSYSFLVSLYLASGATSEKGKKEKVQSTQYVHLSCVPKLSPTTPPQEL